VTGCTAVQRGARHIPHTRGRPAAGNVDGIGAGEAERFVEPNQRVLGGLQIRRCCGVAVLAQWRSWAVSKAEAKPCPRTPGAVPSLFRYQCGSAGWPRSRAPRTVSAAGTRVRSAVTTPAAAADLFATRRCPRRDDPHRHPPLTRPRPGCTQGVRPQTAGPRGGGKNKLNSPGDAGTTSLLRCDTGHPRRAEAVRRGLFLPAPDDYNTHVVEVIIAHLFDAMV